ncbi:hypothetical protein MRX96_027295 [Rhipicephalus microplus]
MCRHRIFQAAPTHKVFCGPKICRFPKIEEDLVELVHQRHSQFLTVNVEPIQIKAQELVPEAGLPNDRFKAIRSWVHPYSLLYFLGASIPAALFYSCHGKRSRRLEECTDSLFEDLDNGNLSDVEGECDESGGSGDEGGRRAWSSGGERE